ncbi:lipopolysaccharide biosynthesis protein [Clostridium perfringens]|uniref:lipopolysaccharide biosynthesis protein n=1 Tax=Clostridium perfringens TaxID=1502 RepID=UPI0018D9121E|nr:oligosaccharide flippase family protein [Clostridium perfringens]MDM0742718.1 oligosaccharide flippase family protein [Clostridium perfringens]QPS30457.1 oligosaccharide flippase family protein [Clostridium perfringens]WFE18154.1 oligosaccharide flippase family protein [Clostridium perfringens]
MRTKKSIINASVGSIGLIITTIFSFITRTIFIKNLGEVYVGLMGLFSNIIVILSLAELGIGSAIIFSLYKPIAENNKEKIKSLMDTYKKYYRIIGLSVLIIGSAVIPFLGILVNSNEKIDNLTFLYILSLLNTVFSYMFFAYKRSLLIADQRAYIVNIISNSFTVIMYIVQIIVLILYKSFIGYLIVQLLSNVFQNIIIGIKVNKDYPFIKDSNIIKLDNYEKMNLFKNIKAIFISRLSWSILVASDNIVLSMIKGVNLVGIYSNYIMITVTIDRIIANIFNSIKGSIGNLNTINDKEKKEEIFKKTFFLNIWIYGICSICLYILFNDLINIWIGNRFLLDNGTVLAIVIIFFLNGTQITCSIYRETMGLFNQYKYIPIISVILNLLISTILCFKLGVLGVCLGTIISKVLTQFWIDPFVIYKFGFNKQTKEYFINYFKISIVLIFITRVVNFLFNYIEVVNCEQLILKSVLVFCTSNIIFYAIFRKNEGFLFIKHILKNLILKVRRIK